MNLAFREAGFNTAKVYLLDLDRMQLIVEYIEGENLRNVLQKEEGAKVMEQVGEEIGKIHGKGFTLGDAKPDNIICTTRGLFITDLEQAKIGGDRTWDTAEFLSFALSFSFDREKAKAMACSFARGYIKFGDGKILEKIKERKYNLIFRPMVAPNVSKMIDSGIEEVIREFKF
jgi:Kae1-associated kinase Bud32